MDGRRWVEENDLIRSTYTWNIGPNNGLPTIFFFFTYAQTRFGPYSSHLPFCYYIEQMFRFRKSVTPPPHVFKMQCSIVTDPIVYNLQQMALQPLLWVNYKRVHPMSSKVQSSNSKNSKLLALIQIWASECSSSDHLRSNNLRDGVKIMFVLIWIIVLVFCNSPASMETFRWWCEQWWQRDWNEHQRYDL